MARTKKQQEQIEDRSYETLIARYTKLKDFGMVHTLLNDYGILLEARAIESWKKIEKELANAASA